MRNAHAIEADFADPQGPGHCVAAAQELLGGVDVLVVCASIQYRTPFLELTAEQIERQIQINFRATIALTRRRCRT